MELPFNKIKEIYNIPTNRSIFINQQKCPISITLYESMFVPELNSPTISFPERIRHGVEYKNISSLNVVALRFGIVAFNLFNEFMGIYDGITIGELSSSSETRSEWSQTVKGAVLYKQYGTGVVYLDSARGDNGAIWRADKAIVLQELQKIDSNVGIENLNFK